MKPSNKEPNRTTRRSFLKKAAAGLTLVAWSPLGCGPTTQRRETQLGPSARSPQETRAAAPPPTTQPQYRHVRIAYIGTGGIGRAHLEHTAELGVRCHCFCDVDRRNFAEAVKYFPKAQGYQDYRRMFDKRHKDFDAVMIGIPDHHHYPATIIAMQLGKHVYTQKPLTHTVWEARKLTEAADRYKVVTQMGNQGHAGEGWRLVYEWIRSGALGQVTQVHTWTNRPIWPQGIERPEGQDPVPAELDWNVWLGPAPVRPFKKDVYHQFRWRGWWDFGAGALGDMACHTMDGLFWALDPGYPTAVEPIAAGAVNSETFPKAAVIKWEFPARGGRPGFVAYWYDGGLMPPLPPELEPGRRLSETGNLFIGTKASIIVQGDYGDSPRIFPESKMQEIGKPPQLLERSPGHMTEWVMAVAGEKPMDYARSNFAYAGPFTEAVLLGNVALRVGRRLEWDGASMTFTNVPEANQYVTKEYRAGWRF
jgi:predicted dehydrogenase